MNHSSSQSSVAITTIVVALVIVVGSAAVNAFLMTATPAYAAPAKEKVIQRHQAEGASATWNDISIEVPGEGTVVSADLHVVESELGTDIAVHLITEEGFLLAGFTTIDQDVFDADSKLTSGTLSPVTMNVFGESPTPIEITIQATWEGTGDLSKTKLNFHSTSDDFSSKFKSSGSVRLASAEGSINNANLGTTTSDIVDPPPVLFTAREVDMTVSENIVS